jgi:MFS transporter, DHA1 family, multidrug resistance protein
MSEQYSQALMAVEPGQKRQTSAILPLLLLVMASYPPLSTDMYLSSLPNLVTEFGTTESKANLTLVLFFGFFAFSTLFWGPISDKIGRKPSLVVGIVVFTLASAGCAMATSIDQLITARILQAIGAGAPVTASLAIVQDVYTGAQKGKILAVLAALMMVVPVVAPTAGAAVLMVAGWRMIFWILFVIGLASLGGCLFIQETLPEKSDKTVLQAFGGLFVVLKNVFFRRALLVFSAPAIYALAFVGGSALILMGEFGQSSSTFSVLFAINAGFSVIGPLLYVPMAKWLNTNTLVTVSFLLIALSGVLIITVGHASAIIFLLCILPGTFAASLMRPLSFEMMMNAVTDSGAASAMINFAATIAGSMGMLMLSLQWESRALTFGLLAIILGGGGVVLWFWARKAMTALAGR